MKTSKKILSMISIFVLLLSFVKPVAYANVEKAEIKKGKYIIQVENVSKYNKIKSEFHSKKRLVVNHKDSDEEYLDESQSVVVEMTKDEAETFSEQDGVTVEKDYSVRADSIDSGEVVSGAGVSEAIPIELSSKKKDVEEYTDDPTKFEPCKKVTDPQKKDEVVPWNIACVAGTPSENKYRGKHIKVAVIDSGIDTHDELNTKGWVDFSDKVNGYKPIDNSGHGTSMAGVIAARINGIGFEGIADEAELYSVKIFDKENTASVSTVIKAIEWCIENNIDIINMSFGMDHPSVILADEIKKAYDEGILMIGAVGNDGEHIQYPAAYPEVISVGSIDKEMKASDFSANEKADLVAPGEEVQTTEYLGSYKIAEGTSIAAAHVTGVAAAVKSAKRKASNEELKKTLLSSAIVLKDESRLVNYHTAVPAIKNAGAAEVAVSELREQVMDMAEDRSHYVTGSWTADNWLNVSAASHQVIVNSLPLSYFGKAASSDTEKKHNRDIVARAARQADAINQLSAADKTKRDANGVVVTSGGTVMMSPYHARSQFTLNEVINHLEFLYELARRRLILGSNLELNAANYNGDTYYGVSIPLRMKRRIIVDLNVLYKNLETYFSTQSVKMNTVSAKGYMVLGLFLHLVQDIQAHRAVVSPSMVFASTNESSYYKADVMTDYIEGSRINGNNMRSSGARSHLFRIFKEEGPIPMIRLKDFLKENENCTITYNNKTYTCTAATAYEDNPYFYRRRYSTAQEFSEQYIERMLKDTGSTSTQTGYYYTSSDVPLYAKKCNEFK